MTQAGTWWQRLGAALFALVLCVLTLGPGLDAIVCRDEAGMSAAAAELTVAEAATPDADHAAKSGAASLSDHGQDGFACIHGHCHHGASYVPVDLRTAATLQMTPTQHVLPRPRVAVSDPKFTLIRPPRA